MLSTKQNSKSYRPMPKEEYPKLASCVKTTIIMSGSIYMCEQLFCKRTLEKISSGLLWASHMQNSPPSCGNIIFRNTHWLISTGETSPCLAPKCETISTVPKMRQQLYIWMYVFWDIAPHTVRAPRQFRWEVRSGEGGDLTAHAHSAYSYSKHIILQ
jgi:hypothetical protein